MKNLFWIILLSIPFVASCSSVGNQKSIINSLNTDGYYVSKVESKEGERLYLKFYYGVGEYEGKKRVKVCGGKQKPDFTSSMCKDTWFIISGQETVIQYRETNGPVSYSVRHRIEDFEYKNI